MRANIDPAQSPALQILTIIQLIIALVELGLLAFVQWAINGKILGSFTSFRVLPGGTGVGLFVTCHTIVFATYFLVTTHKLRHLYNRTVALAFVLGAAIFWLVTWGMYVNVLTLLGMIIPASRDTTTTPLGYKIDDGIWGTMLAIAVVEWLLFVASTVLLWRSQSTRSLPGGNMQRKTGQNEPNV